MLFVGLQDLIGGGEPLDTSRFSFVDPNLNNRSFFEKGGELPWRVRQPDAGSDHNCVFYAITSLKLK